MPAGPNVDLGVITRVPGLSAGALNATLVPPTDVSNYRWVSIRIGSSAYVGTLTFQGSDDLIGWDNIYLYRLADLTGANTAPSVTSVSSIKYGGPIRYQYFQVIMTAYTSGTATAILELRSDGLAGMQLNGNFALLLAGNYFTGLHNNDGTASVAIPAGTVADTVILASHGMLASVLVTTTGTNSMKFYDNASAGSGTIIGLIPANPTVSGVPFVPKAQCANGITAKGDTNNPAVTVFYTPITP